MKKVLFMFLMVFTVFAVAACNGATTLAPTTEAPTTVAPTTQAPTTQAPTTAAPTTAAPTTTGVQDTEAPVISGVDDITIYLNADFDPMEGVSAIDNVDGDITDQITVTGIVDTTKTGTNFLKYSVTDQAGNKKEETRYVYVEVDPNLIGDEIIQNGDFSLGNAVWNVTDGEGSSSSFAVVDEVGVLTVISPSWNPWAPRLESNIIEFENGVTYEITFDAKADAVRSINVQVGQLLSGAPWFVDYKPGQPQIFDLSTDWQTFTFKFTMNNATGEGQLLFENGTVNGGVGTANLATVIYYDNVSIVESTPDPDTAAPIISGATDLVLETGAVYDPLAGVTVFDVVDGNIVLDSSNYVSDVDTSTPGEYTVTYTVSDVAGNIATLTINVTVVSLVFNNTDDITDGSFVTTTTIVPEVQDAENGYADITDPEIWYYYVADWDGAAATFSVIGEAAVIEVTAVGGADWSVMLKQKGIELVTGETYKLTFTASSTVARDIIAKVSDNHAQTFSLTESAATYSFIFTYEGEYKDMERVMFMLGNMANYAASTITIDDVELSILQQEELVVNGDFNVDGWSVWSQDWDQGSGIPTVTAGIVNGEYVVTTDLLGDANWAIQLFQEGLVLEAGKTYRVTFEAMADTTRSINVKVIDGNGAESFTTIALDGTMTAYTFEFLYEGTSTTGKLDFELGVIADSVAGTVTFDNIKFEEVESEAVVAESDQVVNGTFDQVIGWSTWAQDWEPFGGVAISQELGQLLVDVTALGGANWGVQLFQENVTLIEGATYTVTFVAKSSVARDMNFVLIDGNGAEFRKTFDLTEEFATYTFTFTYDGTSTVGKLDFELGNISAASVPALITFEEVNMYRNFNPQEPVEEPTEEVWTAYGTMTLVETETEKTITYVAGDGNWWDSNVQGALVSFDGTNNAIVFTITGEAGHEYLFKFEGGGVFREIVFTASGVQEEITLDLSTLSEAERNGLNLVVLFNHNTAQAGTLVLHGWAYGTITAPAEEVWTGYGMTVVQTETEVTITYADTPEQWWNNNAQGSLVEFDGTNNAIVFTITGEAGQSYLFKIEGGGSAKEVTHIASGSQEDVTLDLSSLTEEQRNGLNLVIIFSNVQGQSGTIVLHGWAYGNVIPQLTTPFGVVVTATEIVWGAIPEATGFEVYIDGVVGSPFAVAAGTYAFNLDVLALDPGTYDITLKAIGDGVNYLDSNLTGVFTYEVASGPTQLTTPFGLVINADTLQWGALPDASSFEIYVDGIMEATVAGGTYSFDLLTLGLSSGGAAIYDIQIKAIGDGVDFTDSELSAVVEYVIPE